MHTHDLSELEPNQALSHRHFVDSDQYDLQLNSPDIHACVFERIGLKRAKFQGGRLHRTRFLSCYLREAAFERVDLTGSLFSDCNLHHASFERCKLWYVAFWRCELDYDTILKNLPDEPNLRMRLLRSLRMNATEMGDASDADRLFLLEKAAERQHLRSMFLHASKYYTRFRFDERRLAFLKFVGHIAQLAVWGYGLRIRRLLGAAISFVLLTGLLLWAVRAQYGGFAPEAGPLTLPKYIYVSAITFTTLGGGELAPADCPSRIAGVAGSLAGVVFLGCLAAAVYRRIRR